MDTALVMVVLCAVGLVLWILVQSRTRGCVILRAARDRVTGDPGTVTETALAVADQNQQTLASMRETALEADTLSSGKLRELRTAATLLGSPDYFDDLVPSSETATGFVTNGKPAEGVPLCGHCLQPGHFRTKCAELEAVTSARA